jgi:type 1 fimbria pilin
LTGQPLLAIVRLIGKSFPEGGIHMKKITVVVVALVLVAMVAFAAGKTYQFTGKVLEVKENVIVVDKKGEKFELIKDANTKI